MGHSEGGGAFTRYNVDFLIAGLIVLLVVLFHYFSQNRVRNTNNYFFGIFIVCAFFDILLDVVGSALLVHPERYPYALLHCVIGGLYTFQLLIPYVLFLYVLSLRHYLKRDHRLAVALVSLPAILFYLLVLTNPFTGAFFSFPSSTGYETGPLYIGMYLYGAFYIGIALLDILIHRRQIERKYIRAVFEFSIVGVTAIVIQAVQGQVLTTGFGIALSVLIMSLTINNPYGKIDQATNTLSVYGLRETVNELEHNHQNYHMVMVVLRDFQRLDQMLGMQKMDSILSHLTDRMGACSVSKQIFRPSTDRFVILENDHAACQATAQALKNLFDQPVDWTEPRLLLEVGICELNDIYQNIRAPELTAFLDFVAAYLNQQTRTSLFQDSAFFYNRYHRKRVLEQYLPEALQNDLVTVVYQPVYSMRQKKIVSAEALSRLSHPVLGDIAPDEFILLAEQTGLIHRLGMAQFEKVCVMLRRNPIIAERLDSIKINLSPLQLIEPDLSSKVFEVLTEYQVDPHKIQFEITETIATVYNERVSAFIDQVTSAGIRICIDDFGSGYANLSAVANLPFDVVKIDRSMLDHLSEKRVQSLYCGIIQAIAGMGASSISEGVETEKQAEVLSSIGVDLIQGFYISNPVDEERLTELVSASYAPC